MLSVKTIGLTAVGAAAIGLVNLADTKPAFSVTLSTVDFTYTYNSGPRSGITGAGFFSYDPSALTGVGAEQLSPSKGNLSVTITNLGGQIETQGPIGIPFANFLNGNPLGIQAEYVPPGASDNNRFFAIFNNILLARETSTGPYSRGIVTYTPRPIPTPALLPGLLGLGAAALRKRKQEQSEQIAETVEV